AATKQGEDASQRPQPGLRGKPAAVRAVLGRRFFAPRRRVSGRRLKAASESERPLALAICFYLLGSTGRPAPVRCARLRADGGPDKAPSSGRRRRPPARPSSVKASW